MSEHSPATNASNRRWQPLFLPVLGALVALAWSRRFVLDDAFISFRYADNLVRGNGLVFNPGERVEGYTNFLWTLLVALGMRLGFEPVAWSWALGLAAFAGTLAFTFGAARLLFGSTALAAGVALLLGTNASMLSFATSGLETQLQACFHAALVFVLIGILQNAAAGAGAFLALSLLCAGAVLTRLDSLIVCGIVLAVLAGWTFCQPQPVRWKAVRLGIALAPCGVIVAAWLGWKLWYYGDILPNTYYVKMKSGWDAGRGFYYVASFLRSYVLWPFALLVGWGLLRRLGRGWREIRPALLLAALVTAWAGYVVASSGDFMEFRFIVPALPFGFLLLGWWLAECVRAPWKRIAIGALVIAGSLHHATQYRKNPRYMIEPVSELGAYVVPAGENWEGIGRVLGEKLTGADARISATALGAIGYYSRLEAIDMHGLTDRWIARHAPIVSTKPGHQRLAPLSYLVERRVNLVIGHPVLLRRGEDFFTARPDHDFRINGFREEKAALEHARIVEIPVDTARNLYVLYLAQSEGIDAAIARNNWRTFGLDGR